MIKIILILALLQYIYYFIFKPKLNILSCGIFGQSTTTPLRLDVPSVNILGIYNIERGKQSCGLTWDGEIHHGIDKDKLYTDFIKNRTIKPKQFPIMFGHTRQASFGNGITLENAHPFGYGTSADGNSFEFIFVHNGTLKNHKELAAKYNIELTVKYQKKFVNTEGTYEATRDKIDSEILGEILWKEKSYHVLSEYVGAAACAWMWCDEPNKLYLWSGASKLHIEDESDKIYEERPLCVYQKSKNNMFFSSLDDSLTTIGGTIGNDIEQISVNHVHIITNGDYKNCEKIKATRLNVGQDNSYRAPRHNNYQTKRDKNYYNMLDFDDCDTPHNYNLNCGVKSSSDSLDILDDKPLLNINNYNGRVYSKSLRFWKNGHPINGVYFYVIGYGFKLMGDSYVEAFTKINLIKNKVFSIDDWSNTLKEGFIPIKEGDPVQLHYFIDGAMLKSISDYIKCQDLKRNLPTNSKYIDMITMSNMTKHPISTMLISHKPLIYFEGKLYTGNSTELGFEKIYYFENGKFLKWEKRLDYKEDRSVITLPMNLKKVEDEVEDEKILNESIKKIKSFEKEYEDDLDRELASKIINTHFENEVDENLEDIEDEVYTFISDFISEEFQELIGMINKTKKSLKDYSDNPIVIDASRILDMSANVFNDFIITPKENKK